MRACLGLLEQPCRPLLKHFLRSDPVQLRHSSHLTVCRQPPALFPSFDPPCAQKNPKKQLKKLLKNLSICFLQISFPLQMCLLQISCQLEIEREQHLARVRFLRRDFFKSERASERERSPQLHPPPRSMDETSLIHPCIFISIFLLLYLYQPVFF